MNNGYKTKGPRTLVFWVITFLYALAIVAGAYFLRFFDSGGTPIGPEDWGDVLAGIFSPLAFLWLVYASLSQRMELELQRNELKQNNKSQVDQFQAMTAQAQALADQVELMRLQAAELARARKQADNEAGVWSHWYLNGLIEMHHQLINYTAHLGRDIKSLDSVEKAERAYRIDDLQGILLRAEAGLPKVHNLPADAQTMVLDLLGLLASHRRATENYVYLARKNGEATEDDLKGFCQLTDKLATKAFDAGTGGLQAIKDAKGISS